jgi:ketosteroid isomerase-like protein
MLGNEILLRQMSREDVEVVRRSLEAFERDGLEGLLRHLDPEIEWTTTGRTSIGSYIHRATYRGHEGMRRYFGLLLDEFEDVRIEPVEFIDAGEQVIVIIRISGRGKRSGAPVELTLVSVGSVRNGKTIQVRNYPSREEALERPGSVSEATGQP